MASRRSLRWQCLHALLALWGCGREPTAALGDGAASHPPTRLEERTALSPRLTLPPPYPSGTWRQLPPERLSHVVLWLSDIVVRHARVEQPQVSYQLNGWKTARLPVPRSREEALTIARRVVELARKGSSFEQLARQYSDEPETASRGGSLGGLPAANLWAWPQVLDAAEVLKPGDVSEVIETESGYHVLYRRAPVPEATVSGRHIVIGHDDAPWLEVLAPGPVRQRSRAEALTLASQIYEQARAQPAEFAQLAAKYSEHRDAVRGGDFGTWSTREPTGYPRELETLEGLALGEVATPIDTAIGIQIIQRVQDQPRQHYATTNIQLDFDPESPDSETVSQSAFLRRANELSAALREEPALFADLQQRFCCGGVLEVISGRERPELEAALAELQPGQIGSQPILDLNLRYLLLKRLELSALPPPIETSFDLAGTSPTKSSLEPRLSAAQ